MDLSCDADGQWKTFEKNVKDFRLDAGPIIHRGKHPQSSLTAYNSHNDSLMCFPDFLVPCIGYVFTEPPRAEGFSDAFFDQLDRNRDALQAQGIRNPRSLISKFKDPSGPREPIPLPDGTLLHPPPLSIPGRKLVILGDTCDPSGVLSLAQDASFLVHEATNANVDSAGRLPGSDVEREAIKKKAMSRGHSTAEMAGLFAQSIRARRLYMNHFSTK